MLITSPHPTITKYFNHPRSKLIITSTDASAIDFLTFVLVVNTEAVITLCLILQGLDLFVGNNSRDMDIDISKRSALDDSDRLERSILVLQESTVTVCLMTTLLRDYC
jgi:hypothetical protein